MRTLTYQLRDLKKVNIEIGFEGENNRTQVRIDCGEVFAEYPNAEADLKVQAPKGGIYPATVTRDGDMILWTVRDSDVANKGNGEFQLTFTDGDTVVKTCPGKIHVERSLKGSGTAPSGVQDWLERAEEALEGVEAAEIHQPMVGLDGYWYKWDQEAQQYVSTGTKAQGQNGKGIDHIAKTGTSGNVDTYTITYTDGTETTYTVTNGEGGNVIDDTAPAADKTYSSNKVEAELEPVKNAIDGILVEQTIGDTVTVTNIENARNYYDSTSSKKGFNKSFSNGILTLTADGNAEASSPYVNHPNMGLGTKKWIFGFKYKLTKVSPTLSDPSSFRIYMGQTQYFDESIVWGEWQNFAQVQTLDLTRIRISMQDFPSIPAAGSYYIEIKEMYLYDADGIDNAMCNIIIAKQQEEYQDGTVTYGESREGYFPDVGLQTTGKAADSKAVGDAISGIRLNVKEHGVKGDGITDDTAAINALFENSGTFYFPAGTYKISGTLVLHGNSTIYGDGDLSVIDMYSCDNLSECVFRGTNKVYPYILTNGNYTKFHDFKLTGNNTTQTKRHAGIGIIDAEHCEIKNVTVFNINYDASQVDPDTSGYGICILRSGYAIIENCYVEQCGYECIGIVDYSHNCVVKNCIAKNGWRCCMQIHRGAHDVSFIGNTMIEDSQDQEWDALFTLHGLANDDLVKNLRIENNTFIADSQPRERTLNYAAVIQLMSWCDGLWFINNRVTSGDRALFADSSVSHLVMIGNLFQCAEQTDYRIKVNSTDSVIVGNVCENVTAGQVVIASGAALAGNIGIS